MGTKSRPGAIAGQRSPTGSRHYRRPGAGPHRRAEGCSDSVLPVAMLAGLETVAEAWQNRAPVSAARYRDPASPQNLASTAIRVSRRLCATNSRNAAPRLFRSMRSAATCRAICWRNPARSLLKNRQSFSTRISPAEIEGVIGTALRSQTRHLTLPAAATQLAAQMYLHLYQIRWRADDSTRAAGARRSALGILVRKSVDDLRSEALSGGSVSSPEFPKARCHDLKLVTDPQMLTGI